MSNATGKDQGEPNVPPTPAWLAAPRPDYSGNTNLLYAYSETPDLANNTTYGFHVEPIIATIPILDYYGEGRIVEGTTVTGFPGAYNVNAQYQLVSNGSDTGCKIPNRIPLNGYGQENTSLYLKAGICTAVTIMGAPIAATTATDIARAVAAGGTVITYGFDRASADLSRLNSALAPKTMMYNPLYLLTGPFDQIHIAHSPGEKSYYAFSPVSAVQAQFVNAANTRDYGSAGQALRSMYTDFSGAARPSISVFLAAIPNVQQFPVLYAMGDQWDSTLRTQFLIAYVASQDLRNLLQACWQGQNVQLSCQNTDINQTVYLNGTGELWSDGPTWRVTTDKSGQSGATFNWTPMVQDGCARFEFLQSTTPMYLNGTGELWSRGPSYWVTSDPTTRSEATFDFNVETATGGVSFWVSASNGKNYLNGMGTAWSRGPSYFVSTDPASRGGTMQLVWKVIQIPNATGEG
jgi:hypothetical protein